MAIKDTFKHMKDLLNNITQDLDKAEGGNKAASQRVRTGTVRLEKVAKLYRKESIKTEKQTKGSKKPAKKAGQAKKASKSTKSSKSKSVARPRAMSFKKPTAKLPIKRAYFR